jgi:hypothetical protein
MAINLEEVDNIYKKLEDLGKSTLDEYLNNYDITPKDRAQIISTTISTMLTTSVQAHIQDTLNQAQVSYTNAQENALNKEISMKEAESTQDILNKKAQVSYTNAQENALNKEISMKEAESTQDILNKKAQVSYTNAQENALNVQLEDNRKIKTLNSISSTYGTMGAGGGVVSSDMWEYYFNIAKSLTGNNINIPTDLSVSKLQ